MNRSIAHPQTKKNGSDLLTYVEAEQTTKYDYFHSGSSLRHTTAQPAAPQLCFEASRFDTKSMKSKTQLWGFFSTYEALAIQL